jgi:hypothetical protein
MITSRWIRCLSWTALLLAGLSAARVEANTAPGAEPTAYLPVWLADATGARGNGAPALLNLPPGWCIGDAAAVIAPDAAWPPRLREDLIAALLASGAAVLELAAPDGEEPREATLRRNLGEALATLTSIEGAGLMVAIGFGEGGDALLAAAETADEEGHRYAAVVRLGPGAPRFAVAEAPEEEAWTLRAPLFCDLLAAVQPMGAADVAAACVASLAALR